jgi:S-layer protein
MSKRRRAHLRVEILEDRWVPANVRLASGYLLISPSAGESALNLTVQQTAANTFTVKDGASTLGTYGPVGYMIITGGNGADTITVDLNGLSYTGSILANTGAGNDVISITNNSGTAASIGGDVTLLPGLGNDTALINAAGTSGALSIGGSVQVTDQLGNDTGNFGNDNAITTVGGSLTFQGMNSVQMTSSQNDRVGGSVNVSVVADAFPLIMQEGAVGGTNNFTVGGSFNITGGAQGDVAFLRGMALGGNLNANMGEGANKLAISSSAATVTTVNGNLYQSGGTGSDTADLRGGVVNGNVTLNLGDGNDEIDLESFGGQPTVFGANLTINAGNGNLTIGTVDAQVTGNVYFNLGNGNTTVDFSAASSVGGTLNWHSGSGNNSLILEGGQQYLVNVVFGSGDDTFTLNNAAAVLTGKVDGGGHITANVFNQLAGTIGSPFELINFP